MASTLGVTGLGLARTGDTAVGGGGDTCGLAISRRMHTLGKSATRFTNRRYLLILHLNQSAGSPTAALGHRLLVGRKVEEDEEEQVRRDDADTGDGSEFFTSAFACIGKVWPVGAGEVGPGCEVNEAWESSVSHSTAITRMEKLTKIQHELDNLHHSDVLLPPDSDTASALEVVPVHDDVDHEVQGNDDPRNGGVADKLGVAEQSGSAMVVGVKEGWMELAMGTLFDRNTHSMASSSGTGSKCRSAQGIWSGSSAASCQSRLNTSRT